MSTVLPPRDSGEYVRQRAVHVTIDDEAVNSLASIVADAVQDGKLGYEAFKYNSIFPHKLQLSLADLINWTFVVDALNFNFWTPDGEPKFTVKHGNTKGVGYIGMVTAVNRAIAEGKPMYDPKYYGQLTEQQVRDIFRSDTPSQIPLFADRIRVLKEVAATLEEKYAGTFENVLAAANGDALKLVNDVTRDFACFRDEAVYEGQRVALYKRAQILAADLDVLLAVNDQKGLKNIDQLTMFADYRVPQVLLYYGALKYSHQLMQKLEKEYLFENGSTEEVEIRCCSIAAVERVVTQCRRLLEERGKGVHAVNSVRVDYFMWDYRVQHAKQLHHVPYHRTRCIYY